MHEDEPLKAGLTLVLGGARSGKTQRALKLAEQAPQRTMIATAEAWDDEMADRIAAHKAERGSGWCTIEAPIDICNAINEDKTDAGSVGAIGRFPHRAIVIDCLTIWLNNLMHHQHDVAVHTDRLLACASAADTPVIAVSNEVGLGIVPENALARSFRDAQGRLNQQAATVANRVEFIAAGLPLRLK